MHDFMGNGGDDLPVSRTTDRLLRRLRLEGWASAQKQEASGSVELATRGWIITCICRQNLIGRRRREGLAPSLRHRWFLRPRDHATAPLTR